jgi:hypothetical protein
VSTEAARISAANQARRRSIEVKLDRVRETLQVMRRARIPITYQTVARRSDVSRTFLYQNVDAKTLMTTAITATGDHRRLAQADHDAQIEASWQQRALNAEEALKAAYTEIATQRDRIGVLLGQIRDLQASTPRTPSSASPSKTPPSNDGSASSPTKLAVSAGNSNPPAPTTGSSTNASPTSKHSSSTRGRRCPESGWQTQQQQGCAQHRWSFHRKRPPGWRPAGPGCRLVCQGHRMTALLTMGPPCTWLSSREQF